MSRYILRLLPDGDIEIIKEYEIDFSCRQIYHKTYNPGDSLKENLINAFEEWEKLANEG